MAKTDDKEKTKKCLQCCCFRKPSMPDDKNSAPVVVRQVSKVPFCGDLPNDLTVGNVICVTGFIVPNCIRFAVNLKCGKGPDTDIAFHFNPRLDRNYIVRNCRLEGRWGEEETASIVKFSIPRNQKFEIDIFIANEEFLISINGKHFCAFRFRVPLSRLTNIEIHGPVDVHGVEFQTWDKYPANVIENTTFDVLMGGEERAIPPEKMTIPCTGHLPKGFQVGWQLEIYGRVKLLPHSFYINLQDGAQLWPHPIIPLHLNPRFSGAGADSVFVRNAWLDGRWGFEERTPGFQFAPGAPFSLAIRRAVDHFSVWVDGQLAGEFKFRSSADNIDTIYIQGDVVIQQIVMHDSLIDFSKKPYDE